MHSPKGKKISNEAKEKRQLGHSGPNRPREMYMTVLPTEVVR